MKLFHRIALNLFLVILKVILEQREFLKNPNFVLKEYISRIVNSELPPVVNEILHIDETPSDSVKTSNVNKCLTAKIRLKRNNILIFNEQSFSKNKCVFLQFEIINLIKYFSLKKL